MVRNTVIRRWPSSATRLRSAERIETRAPARTVVHLLAAAALLAAVPVLAIAAPASAHNYIVSSTPEAGSTLTQLPEQFSVTTNDTLLDLSGTGAGFGLLVQDSAGKYYGDGCFTISGATLSSDAALGAAGKYTLTWQLVSTDAHPVSGDYTFDWAPPADATPSEGSATAPDCDGTNDVDVPAAESEASAGTDIAAVDSALPWIAGAVVAVGLAIGVTLFLVRPRKKQ